MTVLRSHNAIIDTSKKLEPSGMSMRNVVPGPVTPPKTCEFVNKLPGSSTCNSVCTIQNAGHVESRHVFNSGSIMVLETGTLRRRSARLAPKVRIADHLENGEVVCWKRKKVESNSFGGKGARNLDLMLPDLDVCVENSDGFPEEGPFEMVMPNLAAGGGNDLITDTERAKESGAVAKSGLDCDAQILLVETEDMGKQKKRAGMGVKRLCLESYGEADVEKGFLSLRSGKRICKTNSTGEIVCTSARFEGIENNEKRGRVLGSDLLVEANSVANVKEDRNGHLRDMGVHKGDKAKGNVGTLVSFRNDSVNKGRSGKEEIGEMRPSNDDKGKMNVLSNKASSSAINIAKHKTRNVDGSSFSANTNSEADESLQEGVQVREADMTANEERKIHRARFRNIARRNASRFAHFSSEQEAGSSAPGVSERDNPMPEAGDGIEDWPGPFSTAMKILSSRKNNKQGEQHVDSNDKSQSVELKWVPKKQDSCIYPKQVIPLQDMCLSILSKNVDAITSLDFVPDVLRHKICWFLSDSRRMHSCFLELLVRESPSEIRVRDCSWLSEELFMKIFGKIKTSTLTVLQLDQCGSCLPDYALNTTLACSPNSLPALTTISLKGAYRLSDSGLNILISSAPSLKSIDVSQCSLLTSEGICSLAESLRLVLRELYLDHCQGIDAMLILPALLQLENLEVLSLAGLQTVGDDFVRGLISVRGLKMKELVLADCIELTDSSLKVIGEACSELYAIDLMNLCKLTDVSIGHLANGCQSVRVLKLCRNSFSDEAIAAYLDARGGFLKNISLNNVSKISNHTALSLARNCQNLRRLDLSWCRNLTNEALGLVVDSCLSLEVLNLFGCSQVTDVFIEGHSNPQVKIIGLKMTPMLKHIDEPDFLQGPLRYSSSFT